MGIELDEIAENGPAKGHRYSCHVFECSGQGCTHPPGYCDCDKPERDAVSASDNGTAG